MNEVKVKSNEIGIGTLLTLIFVVLKLVGTIDWSWWWVLSPTLIPIALMLVIALVLVLVGLKAKRTRK